MSLNILVLWWRHENSSSTNLVEILRRHRHQASQRWQRCQRLQIRSHRVRGSRSWNCPFRKRIYGRFSHFCSVCVSNHLESWHQKEITPQIKKEWGTTKSLIIGIHSLFLHSLIEVEKYWQNLELYHTDYNFKTIHTTEFEERYWSCWPQSNRYEPFPIFGVNHTHLESLRQENFWSEMLWFCRRADRSPAADRCRRLQWWKQKLRKKVVLRWSLGNQVEAKEPFREKF